MARPGDWACPNESCINATKLVFGKYEQCPKCGSPKAAMNGGGGGGKQSGDWPCPNVDCLNHVKMVFGRHSECPKCGSAPDDGGYGGGGGGYGGGSFVPRNGGYHQARVPMPTSATHVRQQPEGEERPEDWQCSNMDCINHTKMVFGKHEACPSCGTSKNADKAGDWQCPNQNCQNHRSNVFAKRSACPKCGAPRPDRRSGGRAFAPPLQGHYGKGGGQFMYQEQMQPVYYMPAPMAPMMAYGKGGGGGKNAREGDWKCPNRECINNQKLVFARHESCPKCGEQKGATKVGDWKCPNEDCINRTKMVFGSRDSCPKCGSEKPAGGGGRGRSRSPRGRH